MGNSVQIGGMVATCVFMFTVLRYFSWLPSSSKTFLWFTNTCLKTITLHGKFRKAYWTSEVKATFLKITFSMACILFGILPESCVPLANPNSFWGLGEAWKNSLCLIFSETFITWQLSSLDYFHHLITFITW